MWCSMCTLFNFVHVATSQKIHRLFSWRVVFLGALSFSACCVACIFLSSCVLVYFHSNVFPCGLVGEWLSEWVGGRECGCAYCGCACACVCARRTGRTPAAACWPTARSLGRSSTRAGPRPSMSRADRLVGGWVRKRECGPAPEAYAATGVGARAVLRAWAEHRSSQLQCLHGTM